MKRVISLWLPRFATDRLSRTSPGAPHPDPSLPVASVSAVHGGQRLAAVNDAAQARGLSPGLPLADARALVPDVRIHAAAPEADLAALDKLCAACERYTPMAAMDPLGGGLLAAMGGGAGLWLDVTGCTHLFGGEEALLADLVARCARAGYRARAGLAATPGAAWALARFGGADVVRPIVRSGPGEDRARLKPLPVAALRLDPGTIETLDRMGLRRVEDLIRLPRAPLAQRFGRAVIDRLDQALGELEEPISPRRAPPRHHARRFFAEPIGRPEDIEEATRLLLHDLCERLERHGIGARTLALHLHHVDDTRSTVEIGTSRAVRTPDHLLRLFRDKLEGFDAGFGVEVMVLAADATALMPARQDALSEASIPPEDGNDPAHLIDRLAGRLGGRNVARLAARQSHLPERACRETPAMSGPAARTWPTPPRPQPRPVKLLAQPLPIDVMAPVPDGPPAQFRWRRRSHKVTSAEGPERIAPEWWRSDGAPLSREVRDYYRLEDEDGRRFWVYREGLYRPDRAPGWFIHGFFA